MPDEIKQVAIKEFEIEKTELSCTWFVVGAPGSGKSNFIQALIYYNRNKYPVVRVFNGSEDSIQNKNRLGFSKHIEPLYCTPYYDEEDEKRFIARQRQCLFEKCTNPYAINILDDIGDDPKLFKTKVMRGLFKLGSRHWAMMAVVGTQYAIDLPTDIRSSVSYVAIFKEPNEVNRVKLYKNFGGCCGSYQNFCQLMDVLTGEYSCMIINRRSNSNNIEDCVFYFKADNFDNKKFNMGCQEFRDWAKSRYNPNYVEDYTTF